MITIVFLAAMACPFCCMPGVSGLGVALVVLCLWLPSSALLSVAAGAALTARAQVKG